MDSHARSIVKAVSYRVFAFIITASVIWALTRRLDLAAGIACADALLKVGAFYLHERAWNRIAYGRGPRAEYEI